MGHNLFLNFTFHDKQMPINVVSDFINYFLFDIYRCFMWKRMQYLHWQKQIAKIAVLTVNTTAHTVSFYDL